MSGINFREMSDEEFARYITVDLNWDIETAREYVRESKEYLRDWAMAEQRCQRYRSLLRRAEIEVRVTKEVVADQCREFSDKAQSRREEAA